MHPNANNLKLKNCPVTLGVGSEAFADIFKFVEVAFLPFPLFQGILNDSYVASRIATFPKTADLQI